MAGPEAYGQTPQGLAQLVKSGYTPPGIMDQINRLPSDVRGWVMQNSPGGGAQQNGQAGGMFGGVESAYGLYNTAIEQQAGDYGNIMNAYKGFNSSQPMQNLGELASTGGYSEADKQQLRERSVSPIRSIYAGANRDVDRQKAIQGGYSPNYGAVKAKMARDLSQDIGDRVTNVNAGIAQNVAQNRVSLAPSYAAQSYAPIQGQQSLYQATPGLAQLYGNMANQQAGLQNSINQGVAVGGGGSPSSTSGSHSRGISPYQMTQQSTTTGGSAGTPYTSQQAGGNLPNPMLNQAGPAGKVPLGAYGYQQSNTGNLMKGIMGR